MLTGGCSSHLFYTIEIKHGFLCSLCRFYALRIERRRHALSDVDSAQHLPGVHATLGSVACPTERTEKEAQGRHSKHGT